jgi:prevent-host-death family protein
MINVTDIHSLTDFQRNAKALIGKVKESRNPLVLTIHGRAEVVIQDAESYQGMLDRLRALEDLAAIREGLAQADAGITRSADEFFAGFVKQHGIQG